MEKFGAFLSCLSLILLVALPELKLTCATTRAAKSKSFSLRLIHRDSTLSPLYPGNLTFRERLDSYIRISESRTAHLKSILTNNRATHPEMMRPYVFYSHSSYLVQLSIGTPAKTNLLLLDTGSELVWVQCQPCKSCFNQSYPIFDPRNSSSYNKLPCGHPACSTLSLFQCVDGECVYSLQYGDGSSTKGLASTETFTITSAHQPTTHFIQMLFGCSNDNLDFSTGKFGAMAGIVGLSKAPASFISQLGSFILRRFSYCFVSPLPNGDYALGYLKFGTDMGYRGPSVQTTKFLDHPSQFYFLSLQDISVNDQRLNYPPHTFDIKPSGRGGCFIDSGTVITYLHADAYWKLHNAFVSYFDQFRLGRFTCPPPFQLCYILPKDFNSFPPMTYHFADANLQIAPENVFVIDGNYGQFALAVAPHDLEVVVLGSWQQRDTRFVYDLNIDSLSFVPENCSQDSG